jgi:hypothetical protein
MGAGVDFDFATLSFHVPMVLSAPKAATAAIATVRHALMKNIRIGESPKLQFVEKRCRKTRVMENRSIHLLVGVFNPR